MQASELIERLTRIVSEHGDLPVYQHNDYAEFLVEDVFMKEPEEDYSGTLPKRVYLKDYSD